MADLSAMMTQDIWRLGLVAGVLVVLSLICVWAMRRKPGSAVDAVDDAPGAAFLVLYASQTGQAEAVAQRTASALSAGGKPAQALSLRVVTAEMLQKAVCALCVVSTTGEGEAPDDALRFERTLMSAQPDLSRLRFAVLALGDRTHGHFCVFGHRVNDWLKACGAKPLRACLEVDDLAPAALAEWMRFLDGLGAGSARETEDAPGVWRLAARHVLNPDSKAQKLVRIDLAPGSAAAWQAGDLIEIVTPKGHRRDYSIASLPVEGYVRLMVRQSEGGDGSRWLTETLAVGDTLKLRLKRHDNFHAPAGNGPLLLVGAGSGLAGLRAHILAAQASGRPCWLIYGERNPVTDGEVCDELITWQDKGSLARLDLAFSAVADGNGRYVQDVLVGRTADLKAWLAEDGSVLCCGGLDMGKAVEAALRGHMGSEWVDEAIAGGRYRRDLY